MGSVKPVWRRVSQELEGLRSQGLYRVRRTLEGPQGVNVEVDGRPLINFSSNDYLGLASSPALREAMVEGVQRYGVGSGASHLICGHATPHHALEEALAHFLRRDAVLLFSTGYMANLGIISSLCSRHDTVYQDRLNHASLIDGARLSGARLVRYAHGTSPVIERDRHGLVVTDGVFSMDGDLANLPLLTKSSREGEALLVIDDAHGLGVIGPTGRGILEHWGMSQEDCPLLVGTLGKAFGTFGAFVAGPRDLLDFLVQKSRTYIYTTALPPALAHATLRSLSLIQAEDWRRVYLERLIHRFRAAASGLGFHLLDSESPIQPIVIGDNGVALAASQQLLERGFLVIPVRPPTVPKGTARLRVTLTAGHTERQVDQLLDALSDLAPGVMA